MKFVVYARLEDDEEEQPMPKGKYPFRCVATYIPNPNVIHYDDILYNSYVCLKEYFEEKLEEKNNENNR